MSAPLLSENDWSLLRAQIERKQEQFLRLLGVIAWTGGPKAQELCDHLFRLLGVLTFWLSLNTPSEEQAAYVRRALGMINVVEEK